jgi:hypothetical protein
MYENYKSYLTHRGLVNRNYKKGGDTGHRLAQNVSLIILFTLYQLSDKKLKDIISHDIDILINIDNKDLCDKDIFLPVKTKNKYNKKRSIDAY